MAYKIMGKLGKRVQYSKPYKTKQKAENVAKKYNEFWKDIEEQYPKATKKMLKGSKIPKVTVIKIKEKK
jgi:hypothetical protein